MIVPARLFLIATVALFAAFPAIADTNLSTIMGNGSGIGCTGTGGTQACSVTDTRLLNVTPGARVCVNRVGTQPEANGSNVSGSSYTRTDGRLLLQSAKVACLNPQVVFGGFTVGTNGGTLTPVGEVVLPNDFYLNMNWEQPSGTNLGPITYLGSQSWDVLPSLSYALTDKSGITLPASVPFYLRLTQSITSSQVMVRPYWGGDGNNGTINYGYQLSLSNNASGQQSGTGPLTVATAEGYAWEPITVVGQPQGAMTAIGWVGVSITSGSLDTVPDTYGVNGYLGKGFDLANPNIPRLGLSRGSSQTIDFIYNAALRLSLMQFVDVVIYDYGTNDIAYVNASASTLEANTLRIWSMIKGQGKPIVAVTQEPRTTSTDSWATTTNQTPITGFANSGTRDQYNAWLYTQLQAGVISALLDPSGGRYAIGSAGSWVSVANTNVEDQTTHGVWGVVGGAETADGTHPSASTAGNGVQRMATLVAALVTAEGW